MENAICKSVLIFKDDHNQVSMESCGDGHVCLHHNTTLYGIVTRFTIKPDRVRSLGSWLLACAEQGQDTQQPRRPDEVGVWEVWDKSYPSHKWQAVVYDWCAIADKVSGLRYRRADGECEQWLSDLSPDIVGVRIGDLPSEEPPQEQQETKPQLIDVAETLTLAVRNLRSDVEWLIERTGADTGHVEHVERLVDQAHDAIAKLREVQQ